mgnify:FL=1
MTKQLRTVMDIIFAGFVVRTREEMKVFENLIGKQLHYTLIENENVEEFFDTKLKPFLEERVKAYADSFGNCCRFAREFTKEELKADIELSLFSNNEVKLIPKNLFSAIVARAMQWARMADFLDYALETAQKYLFPIAKEAEKEAKE